MANGQNTACLCLDCTPTGRSTAKQASPWPQVSRCEARTKPARRGRKRRLEPGRAWESGRVGETRQFAKAMSERRRQRPFTSAYWDSCGAKQQKQALSLFLHCASQFFVSLSRPRGNYLPVQYIHNLLVHASTDIPASGRDLSSCTNICSRWIR